MDTRSNGLKSQDTAEFSCGGCGAVIICTRAEYEAGAIVECNAFGVGCGDGGVDLAWHSSHAGPWQTDTDDDYEHPQRSAWMNAPVIPD